MTRPKTPARPPVKNVKNETTKTKTTAAKKPAPAKPGAAATKPAKGPAPPAAPSKRPPPRASKPATPPPPKPSKPSASRPAETGGLRLDEPRRVPKETLQKPLAAEEVGGLSPDSVIPASLALELDANGNVAARKPGKASKDERLAPDPAVVAQIRELEAQLDRLIDEASRTDLSSLDRDDDDNAATVVTDVPDPSELEVTQHSSRFSEPTLPDVSPFDGEATIAAPRPSTRSVVPSSSGPSSTSFASEARTQVNAPSIPPPPESVFDTARELLSTDFYLRKWGRLAMRGRSEEVDDFGLDPIYDEKLRPLLDFLYSKYFRVETSGIDGIPAEGRCVLVANHSGTLPLDGVMLKTAVKREHPAARDVRWLTEDFITHMPFLGGAMNRLGAVRACQENAERLLANEELVAVFPEGVKGIGKLFGDRYRLQRFGRGGFIKLCLRTSTPVVPVAILGAEETNPMLFRIEHLSKALGVPYVPVTPTFPLLGPLGLLPAPTKWRIIFGEPIDLSAHGPEAADDELLVGKLAERVRASIQSMLDQAVGSRKSVFFG